MSAADTTMRARVEKKKMMPIQRTTGPHHRTTFILPVYTTIPAALRHHAFSTQKPEIKSRILYQQTTVK